jgi:hypothetical protein
MKTIEKMLRAPLPDQLKALLEKFDTEFDASHLRKLGMLADEKSLTWYERRMLDRAYRKASKELNRANTLNAAMLVVLNRKKEEDDSYFDADRYMVRSQVGGSMVTVDSLRNAQFGAIGLQGLMAGGNALGKGQIQDAARNSQYAQAMRNHP